MKKLILTIIFVIIVFPSRATAGYDVRVVVPEPSTLILLGFAIAALGFYLYWRSKKKKL